VLHLDIRACAATSRSQTEGQYYTRPVVLDVYELLRQFIDATDELDSTLIVVSAGPEFLTDPGRGVERYWALKLRISDEVRDRSRTNPYGSLIRLQQSTAPAEEVAS
jgi:phosphoserine phosphatase